MNTHFTAGKRTFLQQAAVRCLLALAGAGMLAGPVPAAAHAATQGADRVATFEQAMAVFNRSDLPGLRQLLDPAFHDVIANAPAGLPPEFYDSNVEAFVHASSEHIQVTLSGCRLSTPDTVTCADTLQGGDLPPLAHIWTETISTTYAHGKMVHMVETLSAQTRAELAAAVAPGMPATGNASGGTAPALWVALLLVLGGLGLRGRQIRLEQ